MVDLRKIKLIIWDLDETFWQGTLSEGEVQPSKQNVELIKALSVRGIINSISSKNDYEKAKSKLLELGIWDYFVFPQISWDAKGQHIKETIEEMNLRACNVLFIDDNPSNLSEALYFSPDLFVLSPAYIAEIETQCMAMEITDKSHKRLQQYKVLEKKQSEKRKMSSNDEFLFRSNIVVEIHYDCLLQIERIYELIVRTNQLNYTKNRTSLDELEILLNDPEVRSGYICVSDKYGDYGISGFYALYKNSEVVHLLFSCRTMGMGVEQYVYAKIGFPPFQTVGEVAYSLETGSCPSWINQKTGENKPLEDKKRSFKTACHVLMKGPCDLEQILGYIKEKQFFDKEFTYINAATGVSIESYNHTHQIVEARKLTNEQKKLIIEELPFSSPEFFSNKIYSSEYDIVFFSLFTDPNLGLYRRKNTGEIVAFGEYCYDLTDSKNGGGVYFRNAF